MGSRISLTHSFTHSLTQGVLTLPSDPRDALKALGPIDRSGKQPILEPMDAERWLGGVVFLLYFGLQQIAFWTATTQD